MTEWLTLSPSKDLCLSETASDYLEQTVKMFCLANVLSTWGMKEAVICFMYSVTSQMHFLTHLYSPLGITHKLSLSFPPIPVAMGSRIVNKFNLRLEFTVPASDILKGCVEKDSKAVSWPVRLDKTIYLKRI